jgi:UDP-3-O-[3-hydroxymyristoyl] glucosamine N-acyltransferase
MFSYQDIERELQKLEVTFSIHGKINHETYTFKSLRNIEPQGIYFISEKIDNPPTIHNSIVIAPKKIDTNHLIDCITLHLDNPQLVFYRLMNALINDNEKKPSGIHPTAIIGNDCTIDPSAYIGPYCILEQCTIGARTHLHSHVCVMRDSIIEDDVTIEPHSTIGATGVAWIWDQSTQTRIMQPQTGLTRIKRGSFIGTDVTVVRGSVNETTTIGEGCVIAHGSKIGHGCQIGPECHFANNISLAGNVTLGKQCFLGSGAVVRPQVKLADKTVVGAGAVVIRSTHEAGLTLTGVPANSKKSIGDRLTGVPKPLED